MNNQKFNDKFLNNRNNYLLAQTNYWRLHSILFKMAVAGTIVVFTSYIISFLLPLIAGLVLVFLLLIVLIILFFLIIFSFGLVFLDENGPLQFFYNMLLKLTNFSENTTKVSEFLITCVPYVCIFVLATSVLSFLFLFISRKKHVACKITFLSIFIAISALILILFNWRAII